MPAVNPIRDVLNAFGETQWGQSHQSLPAKVRQDPKGQNQVSGRRPIDTRIPPQILMALSG